jgi:hypothetical protein
MVLSQISTGTAVIPRIGGSPKTDLDSVIAGLPWLEGVAFGDGIDAITGGVKGHALQKFTLKDSPSKNTTEYIRLVQTESDLNREIETSASGKYNIEGVTVSASMKYLSEVKYSEVYTTLIAQYTSEYDDYDQADAYILTPEAENLLATPTEFRRNYGDYFLAGGRRSSQFTATYTCHSKTVQNMDEFKASFGGEAPEVFSAEGSARFVQSLKDHSIQTEVKVQMEGVDGDYHHEGPWTPEEILKALNWFKDHQKGNYYQMLLKHYHTIAPTYPSTIDIAPAVFVDLSLLYLKAWDVRARYASLPGYYQNLLQKDYTAFNSGIVGHQGEFATDASLRLQYQQQGDILLSRLNEIFDRMDFYFKVLQAVGTEPWRGSSIEEGTGQQSWMYGFSTYAKSNAVTISSETQTYSDSWHIGWREATLDFGTNDRRLYVGWQVISNWNDGSNGEWWKDCDQILLKNRAAVHVKSQYDRGCNWSVRVFWVDALDYQFGS